MKNLLFVLIAVTFTFSACQKSQDFEKDQQPTFTTNIVAGQNPKELQVIQLTNTSNARGKESYLWDFGNGTTSTKASPTVTYDTHGDYAIKLTVKNSGCKDSGEKSTTKKVTILCRFKNNDHTAAIPI